jgi:hypothetical protein
VGTTTSAGLPTLRGTLFKDGVHPGPSALTGKLPSASRGNHSTHRSSSSCSICKLSIVSPVNIPPLLHPVIHHCSNQRLFHVLSFAFIQAIRICRQPPLLPRTVFRLHPSTPHLSGTMRCTCARAHTSRARLRLVRAFLGIVSNSTCRPAPPGGPLLAITIRSSHEGRDSKFRGPIN